MLISGCFEYSYNISNVGSLGAKVKAPLSIMRVCTADPAENVPEPTHLQLGAAPSSLVRLASVGEITCFQSSSGHKVRMGHSPRRSADRSVTPDQLMAQMMAPSTLQFFIWQTSYRMIYLSSFCLPTVAAHLQATL